MLFTLLTFALLASAISVNKIILFTMAPTLLVGIRMFFGGLVLLFYTYIKSKTRLSWQAIKNNLLLLFLIALTTTYIPSILKAYSLKNMISSKMAFFGLLDPFITAILAYFIFNEKLNWQKFLGIIIGFLGSLILIIKPDIEFKAFTFISYPEISILLAVAISRFGWMTAQKLLKSQVYTPAQVNTFTMIISGLIALATAFIFKDINISSLAGADFSILNLAPFKYLSFNNILLFFITYTILIGNALAYTLYAHVLKRHSAVFVSLASFSVPLFVYLYGWLFLSEPLSVRFLVSCIITFIGLLVFIKSEKNQKKNL